MSKPVRWTLGDGVWDVGRDDGGRVDCYDRVVTRGLVGPFDNVARFGEAIELRQMQRAAIPLEGGESARLALPTGVNAEEAQVLLF